MRAFRRDPGDADVVHYQWLTLPGLDRRLLPRTRPRVMTAHYILPPNASGRAARAAGRVFGAMDAVVAHSEHGAARLRDEVGLPADRVRVIPHGAFDYLTRLPEEKPLPEELEGAEGPVVLSFGLLRPYKGLENLLEAFGEVGGDAELWIVGNPRMAVEPLHEMAALTGARVRFVTRFVEDAEIPAIFRAADVVALPYLDAEHSGVLYTGLAFGKPMVVSAVGGFPEVADAGRRAAGPARGHRGARRRAARADRRRGRPRRARRRRPRRRRRSLLLGRGRPPHARALRGAARGRASRRRPGGAPVTTLASIVFWVGARRSSTRRSATPSSCARW